MEQEKIGTKATRSNIIETLYRRGYINGQQISITGLGENIIETLIRYSPEIIEVKLTRDLEEELDDIEEGKKGSDKVFNDVVEELKPILAKFKLSEVEIGKALSRAIKGRPSVGSNGACKVCNRDKIDGSVFCARHNIAYMNIEAGFQKWRYALGYQWREYLEKLSKNTGTGVYAKEIIKDIIG